MVKNRNASKNVVAKSGGGTGDASCWVYLQNTVTAFSKRKAFRLEKQPTWKEAVIEQIGDKDVLIHCVEVPTEPGELRLLVQTPDKAIRRQLVGALRKSKGAIRGVPVLSKVEQ